MKKYISTLVAVGALSAISAMAQGTIDLNSFDGAGGAGITMWGGGASSNSPAANGYGHIEVMGGASAGAMTAITSITLGTAIYPVGTGGAGPGAFDAGYGVVTGVAAQATGFFEILYWANAPDYNSATTAPGAYYGNSGVFTSQTGTVIPPPPGAPIPGTLNTPGDIHLTPAAPVPEPATFALAGLGAAALMIFRRRK